jgi:hypothetical protein
VLVVPGVRTNADHHRAARAAAGREPQIDFGAMTLDADQRRALNLLAGAEPRGLNEAILLAHGFTAEMLTDLVHGDLATVHIETMKAGGRTIEVARMRITDAGRRALNMK